MTNERIKFQYIPYSLVFKDPAGTSRGVLKEKQTFFVRISFIDNPSRAFYAEVPFFPGLSSESLEEVEGELLQRSLSDNLEECLAPSSLSSVNFGVEQLKAALKHCRAHLFFPSDFTDGSLSIEINGLIWMGNFEEMRKRVDEKIKDGFHCIKIKIGAINWEEETFLIEYVRKSGGDKLIIRLDANGAFTPDECFSRLEDLSRFNIHSIEQPIKAGQPEVLRKICRESPIPIALDEELIGLPPGEERNRLLDFISPHYLVLKPALCHGFSGAADWIIRAEEREIGWWITSALESNIGLSAIAQFTGLYAPSLPQGLGTGNLYLNNFSSRLRLEKDRLHFTQHSCIDFQQLSLLFPPQ